MLQWLWLGMTSISILYACINGETAQLLSAALAGTGRSIGFTIELGGGYLFFCGLMEIIKAGGIAQSLQHCMTPVLEKLLPSAKEAWQAVSINLSMNLLGIGNAATPAGIEAMKIMNEKSKVTPCVRQDMKMFLIVNATSIQLLPTTVLTMRVAAGSVNANAVLLPTLLCTLFSAVVGLGLGMLCRRMEVQKYGS